MTRAAVPTFAFPAAPLASVAAQNFVKSNWAYIGGITSFVSFVADPYPDTPNPGTVFKVDYPAGSMGGPQPPAKPGGIPGMMLAPFGGTSAPKQQRAVLSYKTHNEHCFSTRLMWWTSAALGKVYAYIPVYSGQNLAKRDYGISLGLGSWTFTRTVWNEVTQVIVLNSSPGTSGPANGYLAQYVNGQLVMERKDVVFRTDPAVGISRLFFR
ncbi:hypothetical protein RQP46_003720 [Phenoliferia psychrophenolica]